MDIFDIDTDDDFVQPLLRRWAADRYSLDPASIASVEFDFHQGYGGGCDTCGYGADEDALTCIVSIKPGGGSISHNETYSTGLINDILKFAAAGK